MRSLQNAHAFKVRRYIFLLVWKGLLNFGVIVSCRFESIERNDIESCARINIWQCQKNRKKPYFHKRPFSQAVTVECVHSLNYISHIGWGWMFSGRQIRTKKCQPIANKDLSQLCGKNIFLRRTQIVQLTPKPQ